MSKATDDAGTKIHETFLARTPRSRALHERAGRSLPGGDTRTSTFYLPYPIAMVKGQGAYLYDEDGHQYLDFLNNYTSLIHGHADPDVTRAIAEQVAKGVVYGAPCEVQVALAEKIRARLPSCQKIRFTNSGTEATMMAMRAARAYRGREIILKLEGGYHGTHDFAQGPGPGVPSQVAQTILTVPFDDREAVAAALDENEGKVAAVIAEPIQMAAGILIPRPGYLRELREITRERDVLLILDEIVTFRLAPGGAQEREGIAADLTTLGKIIGGGFPIGAFGGRDEILSRFDPTVSGSLGHSGTFNGHPVAMAAGRATLEKLSSEEIHRLNLLGDRLRLGLAQELKKAGACANVRGVGSLVQVDWGENDQASRLFHLALLNRGIFIASRGMFSVSTPMREAEVDTSIVAVREVMTENVGVFKEGRSHAP